MRTRLGYTLGPGYHLFLPQLFFDVFFHSKLLPLLFFLS